MSERTIRQQVIRDRITEESVRKCDTHEIVDWIHGLEDEAAGHEKHIHELESVNTDLVEALEELATCVEDGCYCSEMKMATALGSAREALEKARGER